jgi:hypothetical protein
VSPAVIHTLVETPTRTSESGHPFGSRGGPTLDGAALHNVERVLTALEPRTPGGWSNISLTTSMTMTIYPDPFVLFELYERDQRTREYLETLQPHPPDDDMTAEGGELQRFIRDPVEVSTIITSEIGGPSSNTTADC